MWGEAPSESVIESFRLGHITNSKIGKAANCRCWLLWAGQSSRQFCLHRSHHGHCKRTERWLECTNNHSGCFSAQPAATDVFCLLDVANRPVVAGVGEVGILARCGSNPGGIVP